ncbi:MAG TPA: Ldh family oxidoreductase [Sphingobium sp.]|nr:Ldh family oxidoreductase [Sphingobium sp.]
MIVSAADVQLTGVAALHRAGVPLENAKLQVDLLLEAELRGRASHGLLRLPRLVRRIGNGVADPVTSGTQQWVREAFLEVDGMMGLGPVVGCAALEAAIERARVTGVCVAAVRNNNHLGMIGWYAERVARRGLTAIILSTSEALVHPWGGRRAALGTNPIAIGVPADPEPFVVDLATSKVSMGQIHDHANRGEPLPEGWALDGDGNPTTDAAAARQGAIAPFGEAKGYALGLAFEVLVTCLTGAAIGNQVAGTLDSTQVCNKGDLFIIMDSHRATSAAGMIGAYLDEIRNDAAASGFDRVAIPGDRSAEMRATRLLEGVPVADDVWREIMALSRA